MKTQPSSPRPALASLPPQWRRLIEISRAINFGHLRAINFTNGVPACYGRAVKTIIPGRPNGAAPAQHERLPVHAKWAELIAEIAARGDVQIDYLELVDGLPLKAELAGEGETL